MICFHCGEPFTTYLTRDSSNSYCDYCLHEERQRRHSYHGDPYECAVCSKAHDGRIVEQAQNLKNVRCKCAQCDIQKWIVEMILAERARQDEKFGEQNWEPVLWMSILLEEVGEAARHANDMHWPNGSNPEDAYRDELVQVAAVALAALESLHRNRDRR